MKINGVITAISEGDDHTKNEGKPKEVPKHQWGPRCAEEGFLNCLKKSRFANGQEGKQMANYRDEYVPPQNSTGSKKVGP